MAPLKQNTDAAVAGYPTVENSSCCTIAGSASVVASPKARPNAIPEQPPHYLPGPRLRQVRAEDDLLQLGQRPILVTTCACSWPYSPRMLPDRLPHSPVAAT